MIDLDEAEKIAVQFMCVAKKYSEERLLAEAFLRVLPVVRDCVAEQEAADLCAARPVPDDWYALVDAVDLAEDRRRDAVRAMREGKPE